MKLVPLKAHSKLNTGYLHGNAGTLQLCYVLYRAMVGPLSTQSLGGQLPADSSTSVSRPTFLWRTP